MKTRLSLALFAVAVLSALSAAEATLAAAPMFNTGVDGDWPAQLTPVKDRDSVNPRAARPSDHAEECGASLFGGDGLPAAATGPCDAMRFERIGLIAATMVCGRACDGVLLSRLDLPPPVI